MKNNILLPTLYFIFGSLFISGCVTEHKSVGEISVTEKNCAIIDTDFGVDDLRAISMILPQYNYSILVATEGQTRSAYGVKIGERYLQTVIGHYNGDIFEGKSSPKPLKTEALKDRRESLETMNHLLPMRIAALSSHKVGDSDFKQQIQSCRQVTVFLLAPYTSFHAYKDLLPKGTKAYSSGTFPSPKNKDLGFNCQYDTAACFAMNPSIQKFDIKFFKLSPKYSYYLTRTEIGKLKETDVEMLLKDIHNANFTTWDSPNEQMWDDAVALYLYAPEKFQNKGRQYYPKMKPEQFRASWSQAMEKISENRVK